MRSPSYDYWLFDLDGTLVDVEESYRRRALERVGNVLGCSFSTQEAVILWHGSTEWRRRVLDRYDLDPETFWMVFDRLDDPIKRAESSYLFEDAAVVGDFEEPVGLVTHCPPAVTEAVLDTLDVRDWFDAVVCCTDDTGWKPDPEPVRLAMRDLGVATNGHRGVLAGNGPGDIGAAWNAGLDGIHVERYDHLGRKRSVLGDYRVSSLAEVDGR